MSVFEFKTRVSYDDVDGDLNLTLRGAMGMMQEAAIIHSDQIGYSVYDTERTHVIWMLVHWRIRLVSSAKWNENVLVKTWPRTMDRATSERDFEIVGADGRCIAIGKSVWVLVSTETGRIIRIPSEVSSAYQLTERSVFKDERTALEITAKEQTYSGKILKCNIDTNHHVNNRVYLDFAYEALPDEVSLKQFSEILIHFRKQLVRNERVSCYCGMCERGCSIDVCGTDEKDIRASVELFV